MRLTGLTWGNMFTHLTKLEETGYVAIERESGGKKPHTTIHLTKQGRVAFRKYEKSMQQEFSDLPE